MWFGITALIIIWLLGVSLARHNLKVLRENKEERLRIRREYKRIKNERLRKMFGIKPRQP